LGGIRKAVACFEDIFEAPAADVLNIARLLLADGVSACEWARVCAYFFFRNARFADGGENEGTCHEQVRV
jgi:hypothetical protein